MAIHKFDAVDHLTSALNDFRDSISPSFESSTSDENRVYMQLCTALLRLSPPSSHYAKAVAGIIEERGVMWSTINQLAGIAEALRHDYQGDYLQSFHEAMNAELLDDFVEMAAFLLHEQSLKLPAAVVIGSVLEEHLRKMCDKHGLPTTETDSKGKQFTKKASVMNDALKKAGAYGGNDQKQITAWLGVRNSAAHGKPDEFDEPQVDIMIQGVRLLISRFPA